MTNVKELHKVSKLHDLRLMYYEDLLSFKNLWAIFWNRQVLITPGKSFSIILDENVEANFFCMIFWAQNVSISTDQNVSILFASYRFAGIIEIVWHRKLCIKSWYISKSLWILLIFPSWSKLDLNFSDTPKSYTTLESQNDWY